MRLTLVNFIVRKRPHGHKYRGKHRVVKEVSLLDLRKRYDSLSLQERNMFYLRHPYLTVEQSKGHMEGLKEDTFATFQKLNLRKEIKFARKYTWAEQLSHLRVKDSWE